jgi:UDP-glucose 4-epimerase/UDP-glucuronate decarboxylase
MRRILITGGAGFIGLHLARALSESAADEIVLVDDFSRGRSDADLAAVLARANVRVVTADLADGSAYGRLGGGYDEVYHLAGKLGVQNTMTHPWEVVRGNAMATLLLLDWLRAGGGGRLLSASTSEVYAWTQHFHPLPFPTPEAVPLALTDLAHARSSYAGSKMFGELAVTHACRAAGIPYAIVRFHNVYGPRMGFEHVVPQLYERALGGENPLVVRSAHHVRAFCYVDDAVAATIAAMRHGEGASGVYNIGNDAEPVTIGELARRICALAKPEARVIEAAAAEHDPIQRRCPDIGRARDRLGYRPQVSLDEGLRRTLGWYAQALEARRAG